MFIKVQPSHFLLVFLAGSVVLQLVLLIASRRCVGAWLGEEHVLVLKYRLRHWGFGGLFISAHGTNSLLLVPIHSDGSRPKMGIFRTIAALPEY
jgi:hypothetical protein